MQMDVNRFIRLVYAHKSVSVRKNKLEHIRLLVKEFPDLLAQRGDGFLPLHGVCKNFFRADHRRPERLQIIQRLMEINSSCLLVQDDRGCVPLVCLLSSYSDHDF
jgi:hypothetical protein